MPSVMQQTRSSRASTASRIASAAPGGGTKTTEAFAPVSRAASRTVSKTGMPSICVPPLPGCTPATTWVPYSTRQPGVELAHAAHALHQQPRVLAREDRHRYLPLAAATAFSAASRSVSAGVMPRPESARILRPCSAFVPWRRTTSGT